jgi:glycosyltransferase involved in cell wall biosynthesis
VLSVVVPFFNESANVEPLFARLMPYLDSLGLSWEVVCVNDGSSDDTLDRLIAAHQRCPAVKVIDLSRNFGKDVALSAGLKHARGDAVVPMDADLQHPPEAITLMLDKWREGYDVVYAVRQARVGQSLLDKALARTFYWLFERLTSLAMPREAGDFRLLDRKVVDAISAMPERTRFMKGIFTWVGFRQTGVLYEQGERTVGTSKWGLVKRLRFAFEGMTAFSNFPLRTWRLVGVAVSSLAFFYIVVRLLRTLFYGIDVPGYESIIVTILFLGGMQLLTMGILGDYLGRVFDEVKGRPLFLIRETFGLGEASVSVPARRPSPLPRRSAAIPSESAPLARASRVVPVERPLETLWLSPALFRGLAGLVMLAVLIFVVLTFRDYGITDDEQLQNAYGKMVLAYYTSGFQDRSAFNFRDLFYYGGLFDVVAAALNQVSPFGEYATRHLLGGLVGVLGLFGTWKLTRLLAGERAAFLAALLLALTPSYYGDSFNNPKDLPFAVGMVWTLYLACRLIPDLPRPPRRRVMAFAVGLGLTLGVRVGAGLAAAELIAVLLAHLAWIGWRSRSVAVVGRNARRMLGTLLLVAPVAYGVMILFWPWAGEGLLNPLRAVEHFVHHDFPWATLVDGQRIDARHLPRYYLPLYLAIKLPEVVLVGLAAGTLLLLGGMLRQRRRGRDINHATVLQFALVIVAALAPILIFVVIRPTAYNGIRHFLFVVPPVAVLAAVGLDRLWTLATGRSRQRGRAFGLALATVMTVQCWVMATLHPDEYIYYNALVGGVAGANGRFVLDYWGNSLAEATHRLGEYVALEREGRPIRKIYRVAVCGNALAVSNALPPFLQLATDPAEADFTIALTHYDCYRTTTGRPIIAVERFGADLSVVKDRRTIMPQLSLH